MQGTEERTLASKTEKQGAIKNAYAHVRAKEIDSNQRRWIQPGPTRVAGRLLLKARRSASSSGESRGRNIALHVRLLRSRCRCSSHPTTARAQRLLHAPSLDCSCFVILPRRMQNCSGESPGSIWIWQIIAIIERCIESRPLARPMRKGQRVQQKLMAGSTALCSKRSRTCVGKRRASRESQFKKKARHAFLIVRSKHSSVPPSFSKQWPKTSICPTTGQTAVSGTEISVLPAGAITERLEGLMHKPQCADK